MNRKRQIKIIKKSDIAIAQTSLVKKKSTEKDLSKKISSTLSELVKEFQQRQMNNF